MIKRYCDIDGNLGVLIHKTHGLGWASEYGMDVALDERIIKAYLDRVDKDTLFDLLDEWGYGRITQYGILPDWDDMDLVMIPKGSQFRINEYDGCESVEIYNKYNWYIA